ncbi:MAG: BrnT family toxin [Polynucleobacter sp.]|nr:MAG: BrnT family toxin [Polynucleobacter sp.]
MTFEWDELKSDQCKKLRGFGFDQMISVFSDSHKVITPDKRHDYGEDRFEMLAIFRETIFVVIFTLRIAAIRIISARKANEREKKRYKTKTHFS